MRLTIFFILTQVCFVLMIRMCASGAKMENRQTGCRKRMPRLWKMFSRSFAYDQHRRSTASHRTVWYAVRDENRFNCVSSAAPKHVQSSARAPISTANARKRTHFAYFAYSTHKKAFAYQKFKEGDYPLQIGIPVSSILGLLPLVPEGQDDTLWHARRISRLSRAFCYKTRTVAIMMDVSGGLWTAEPLEARPIISGNKQQKTWRTQALFLFQYRYFRDKVTPWMKFHPPAIENL